MEQCGEISQVQKTEVNNETDVVGGFFYYFQISHSVYLKYLHSLFHNAIPVQVSSLHSSAQIQCTIFSSSLSWYVHLTYAKSCCSTSYSQTAYHKIVSYFLQ